MKRTFNIEWPDEYGELWMNTANLMLCLTNTCRNTKFTVTDITGNTIEQQTAGPINPGRDAKDKTTIMEAVARGWCTKRNSHKILDPDLALDIADEVFTATHST